MSEWRSQPLEAFLDRVTYGFTNPMPTVETGPFMVTAKDINYGRILYEQARRTSQEAYQNELTDKSRPQIGDVLVTKDGTLGRIAIVDRPNVCINQSVALLKPNGTIRSHYLKYLLEEPKNFSRMLADADGSTIKHIYITRLARMEVLVPDVSTQDDILHILASLDEKIDLNRRMNETLGALTRAIFKDWFVEFGPVRRKKAGAIDPVAIFGGLLPDPARAAEVSIFFPSGFADGGLPEGWEEKGLDEVADFLNGLALQKFLPTGKRDLAVIKIAELRSGITAKTNLANREIPDKYVIRDGDFLFSWSGSLMAKFWTDGEGALNQHLFKVTSKMYPQWFYALWVHHHMPEFQTIAASKATTMGHIQRGHLSAARVIVPPGPTLATMTEVIEPLIQRIIHNDLENRTLAETRDYLLPKLMSGEVRVRDVADMAG